MKDRFRRASKLNQVATLLSIGDVKYDILNHLKANPNIQIIEMSTKYYREREREKELGLKVEVKLKENRTNS